jgi:hypothetical protein
MKYADRLNALIASKTDIDPQALRHEVITRFFEIIDDEGSIFIDSLLKFRDNNVVLAAIVMARLEEAVEEVVNDEESLEMTLAEEAAESRRVSH